MRIFLALALLLVPTTVVHAQQIIDKTLSLESAAAPRPALKYRLLPEISEKSPGNAAQAYYRAMLPEIFTHRRTPDIDKQMDRWRSTPIADLPRDEMQWLLTYAPLMECDAAARLESCDWELLARIRKDGMQTRLGDMQSLHELSRLLVQRARLQIAEGKLDEAMRSLQTSFSLSRQTGQAPVLICNLIGIAGASATLTAVEELIQAPGAPNLYWALTSAPAPWIDTHRGLESEKAMVVATMPEMAVTDRAMSQAEVGVMLERFIRLSQTVEGGEPLPVSPLVLAATAEALAPESRRRLEATGFKAELVKSMPAPQAVLLDWSSQYREAFEERVKLTHLPYWLAHPKLEKLRESRKGQDIPVFGGMMPAIDRAWFAHVRLERQLAILRTIEALRLYAAAHEGRFPAKLSDMTETPIPMDPVTGVDFEYAVTGDKATLRAPAPAGEEATRHNSLNYTLVLRKKA